MKHESMQRRACILVIDDDQDITELVQLTFEETKQKILIGHTAEEGIAMFREHEDDIDIVLLDLAFKGNNGVDVLEQIRHLSAKANVVIMSGYLTSVTEARALGANSVLPKPFSLQQLEQTIATAQAQ